MYLHKGTADHLTLLRLYFFLFPGQSSLLFFSLRWTTTDFSRELLRAESLSNHKTVSFLLRVFARGIY